MTTTSFQNNLKTDANRFASINSVDEYKKLTSQPVFQNRRMLNKLKTNIKSLG